VSTGGSDWVFVPEDDFEEVGVVVFIADCGHRPGSAFGASFFYPGEVLLINCIFANSVEDGHAGNFFDEGKFYILAIFGQKEKSTDLNSDI